MYRRAPILPVLLILLSLTTAALAAEFTLEKNDHGVTVKLDGELFTDYLIDNGPKPILWPIIGPGGQRMTRAYPMDEVEGERRDHVHHRSFWFTHGDVNGIDFWSESSGSGSIRHKKFVAVEEGSEGRIVTQNDWVDADGNKILEDERTLVFRAGDQWRSIDFDIVLTASEGKPVTFGDTKEGTFGLRVPTALDVEKRDPDQRGTIINSEGHKNLAAWGKQAPWVDYYGKIDGEPVGVAIMNHPSSFRYPTHWHVRTYGLFAANPFGWHDFERSAGTDGTYDLADGESIRFAYRVLFHLGDAESANVAGAFAAYQAEAK